MPHKTQQTLTLPEELWLEVFTHLEPTDLSRAAQVCRHWSRLIGQSETLWKAQCLSVTNSETKQRMLMDKAGDEKCWREVYRENYGHRLIKRLWMDGKFSNVASLQDLPAKVFCPMDKDMWGEIFERELSR